MQPDDLYQNDSTFFYANEPKDQRIGRKSEKAQTLEALPILEGLVDHLAEQVEFLGSVDAMPKELKTQPTKFMNYHNANEMARNILLAEKEYIEGLIEEAMPKKR